MKPTLAALVGTKFRGEAMVTLLASLPHGESLTLVREPDNKFDYNAIQVWARGQHIGYIKGSQNRDIAMAMDAIIPIQQCQNCALWAPLRADKDRGICRFEGDGLWRKPCGNPTTKTDGAECPEFRLITFTARLSIEGGPQPMVEISANTEQADT